LISSFSICFSSFSICFSFCFCFNRFSCMYQ
jgi:hypothetical protein